MKEYKLISDKEREHLFSMLLAPKLDLAEAPRHYVGVAYGEHDKQEMNIYLPEDGTGPYPVIFFIHGGGWQGGSRGDAQVKPFLHGIHRGYAVISCGYRLLPDGRFPENLFDIKAALRFIKENGDQYCLNAERIVIAGASAGAQLALMAGFTVGVPAFEGGDVRKAPKIKAIIDQFGPTDFENEDRFYDESDYPRMSQPSGSIASALLDADAVTHPALYSFLSPINNVHPGIPPVLILQGKFDPMVAYQHSENLFKKICDMCGQDRAKLIISDDCTHADTKYESEPYTTEIFDFIEKNI